MSPSKRIARHARANAVAYLALFVALGGTSAYAANTIFSTDIVDGEVKTADLADAGVTRNKIASGAVTLGKVGANAVDSTKVVDNSLRGDDLLESSLNKVPNADKLDGLDSSAFTSPACSSQSGAVKGFARVDANGSFSTEFTTAGVQFAYNCSGGTVEARRNSILGVFEIRFNGNPARLAVASPETRLESQAAVRWNDFFGGFVVTNLHVDGTTYSPFTIILV